MGTILEVIHDELANLGVDSERFDNLLIFQWDNLLNTAKNKVSDEELSNWDIRCATNLLHRLHITGFTNDNIFSRLPTCADMNENGAWQVGISG